MNLMILMLTASLMGCAGGSFSSDSRSGLSFSETKEKAADAKEAGKQDETNEDKKMPDGSPANPYVFGVQWPPNHRMESFSIDVIGDEADVTKCKIASIASDEIQKSADPEDLDGDYKILSDLSFEVRIERLGDGDGRVYTVAVSCGEGEEVRKYDYQVIVPHDWSEEAKK